jgi:hypothetical protein
MLKNEFAGIVLAELPEPPVLAEDPRIQQTPGNEKGGGI